MENETEEEEWVLASVLVELYGYKVRSLSVLAFNDRKIGRTDRIKKVGHRLYVNIKKFSRRPSNGNNLRKNWQGKDPEAEYDFKQIAAALGLSYQETTLAFASGMAKIAKLLIKPS
jgi:hypothetical protein